MQKRSRSLVLFLMMILIIPSITCTILKPKSDAPERQPGKESSDDVKGDDSGEALPEATGDEIEVTQTTTYQDEFGYWNLHGLITNVAEYPVGGIGLEVQLSGAAVVEPAFLGAYGIAPGEIQPFSFRLPISVTDVEGLQVNVVQIKRVSLKPVQLEIGQFKHKIAENGIVTLVGEVQNNSNSPALIYSTKAGIFSADGELITTASCQVCPGYMTPGEKAPAQFLVYGHPASPTIDHYEIYTTAEKAATVEELDLVFLDPIHTYTDPVGNFHVLGYLENNSEKILALQLMGTFYSQNGEIIGASSYNMPVNSLLPGNSAPYDLMVTGPIESVGDWSIQVNLARSSERIDPAFQLPTTTTVTSKEQYSWTVSGTTTNDSEQSLSLITIVIGLRDEGTGKLVGLTQHIEAGEFPVGASLDINLTITPDPAFAPGALEEFILVLGE